MNARTVWVAALACGGVALAVAGCGGAGDDATPDRIVGLWVADAARIDCTSGTVLANFTGMQVFHDGGTLTDTNSSAPSTRGPGFGFWSREGERYSAKFRFARYLGNGALDGYTVVTRAVTLDDSGNTATGTASVEIRDASDVVVARACARDTARRQ